MHDGRTTRAQVWIARGIGVAPLVALALAWLASPSFRATLGDGVTRLVAGDLEGLRAWGTELGPRAAAFTALLMLVQALAAPIPAVLITWTNAWLFGPFVGAWLSIGSATAAALVCFALARGFGAPWVERCVPATSRARAERFLADHGAAAVLVGRLLPFVPFDPLSFVAGLSSLRASTFVWATFVGQLPAGFAYSYLAAELTSPARFVLFGACTFAALAVVGLGASRIVRGRKSA